MKDKDISTIKQYETSRINPHNTECYSYFQQQELISQHILGISGALVMSSIFWGFQVHWWWAAYFGDLGCGPNRNFAMENAMSWFTRPCILPLFSAEITSWFHLKSTTRDLLHLFCPKGRSISWALRPKICVGFFLSYFFFSKEKVSILCVKPGLRPGFTLVAYSFWFNGQAVRPGLFALQAVRPEVHTGPARKGWTSLNISGRKAWDVYCVKSRWDTWISH